MRESSRRKRSAASHADTLCRLDSKPAARPKRGRHAREERAFLEAVDVGVADAVDAMGSTRPYRAKRTVEYVISELENGIGKQFDPRIANIFISLLRSGEVRIDDTDESSDHISD